jgi:hypothetical protein
MFTFVRQVPTGSLLRVLADAVTRHDPATDPVFSAFLDQVSNPVLQRPALHQPEAEDLLLLASGGGPAGEAFRATLRRCLERTTADTLRPYDLVRMTTNLESTRLTDRLDTRADVLAARSPLLDPVAEVVRGCPASPDMTSSVAELVHWFGRFTSDGVDLAEPDLGHDGGRVGGDTGGTDSRPSRVVSWADADLLVPGTAAELTAVIDVLWAALPPVAAFDNGAARKIRRTD